MICSKCGLEIEEDKKECPVCNDPLTEQSGQENLKHGYGHEGELTPEDELALKELIADVNKNLEEMPDTDIKSVEIETDEQEFNVEEEDNAEAEGEESIQMEEFISESPSPGPEPKVGEEITKESVDVILDELDTADNGAIPLKQKRLSKALPAVVVIVVVVIAAAGGVFYIKSKQEPTVTVPSTENKVAKRKDEVLKKVLKREEKKVLAKKNPVSEQETQKKEIKKETERQKADLKVSQGKITEKHIGEKVDIDRSFPAESISEAAKDKPATVYYAPEKDNVLPEHPDDEKLLSRASIKQEDLLPSTPEMQAGRDGKAAEKKIFQVSTKKPEKAPVKPVKAEKQTKSSYIYSVHAGSYKNRKGAVSEANRLKGLEFDAYTEEVNLGEKGIWHRVKIGRFGTREEALKVQEEIMQKDSKISLRIIKS